MKLKLNKIQRGGGQGIVFFLDCSNTYSLCFFLVAPWAVPEYECADGDAKDDWRRHQGDDQVPHSFVPTVLGHHQLGICLAEVARERTVAQVFVFAGKLGAVHFGWVAAPLGVDKELGVGDVEVAQVPAPVLRVEVGARIVDLDQVALEGGGGAALPAGTPRAVFQSDCRLEAGDDAGHWRWVKVCRQARDGRVHDERD